MLQLALSSTVLCVDVLNHAVHVMWLAPPPRASISGAYALPFQEECRSLIAVH
mgnify:CR=1 FL=1